MASLQMKIPHQLSQEEALKRIKKMLTETSQQHADKITGLKEEWNENVGTFQFSAMGYDLAGTLTVNPSDVEVDADVPFAVTLFKGVITKMIGEKATELLS